MKIPKKLVRILHSQLIPDHEKEVIDDQAELNTLYELKVREELLEIRQANHKDIYEFVDLIQAAWSYAIANGFSEEELVKAGADKKERKGEFGNIALIALNPNNPSNALYFKNDGTSDCL